MPKHITNILEDSDDPLFTIVNKIFMVTLRSRKKNVRRFIRRTF